jgi:hypothetical protein
MTWPFPPATGPIPWTLEQIRQYARQQRDQMQDAPL